MIFREEMLGSCAMENAHSKKSRNLLRLRDFLRFVVR